MNAAPKGINLSLYIGLKNPTSFKFYRLLGLVILSAVGPYGPLGPWGPAGPYRGTIIKPTIILQSSVRCISVKPVLFDITRGVAEGYYSR